MFFEAKLLSRSGWVLDVNVCSKCGTLATPRCLNNLLAKSQAEILKKALGDARHEITAPSTNPENLSIH